MAKTSLDIIIKARNETAAGLHAATSDFKAAKRNMETVFGREGATEAERLGAVRRMVQEQEYANLKTRLAAEERASWHKVTVEKAHVAAIEEDARRMAEAHKQSAIMAAAGWIRTGARIAAVTRTMAAGVNLVSGAVKALKGDWQGVEEVISGLPFGIGQVWQAGRQLRAELDGTAKALKAINEELKSQKFYLDLMDARITKSKAARKEREQMQAELEKMGKTEAEVARIELEAEYKRRKGIIEENPVTILEKEDRQLLERWRARKEQDLKEQENLAWLKEDEEELQSVREENMRKVKADADRWTRDKRAADKVEQELRIREMYEGNQLELELLRMRHKEELQEYDRQGFYKSELLRRQAAEERLALLDMKETGIGEFKFAPLIESRMITRAPGGMETPRWADQLNKTEDGSNKMLQLIKAVLDKINVKLPGMLVADLN